MATSNLKTAFSRTCDQYASDAAFPRDDLVEQFDKLVALCSSKYRDYDLSPEPLYSNKSKPTNLLLGPKELLCNSDLSLHKVATPKLRTERNTEVSDMSRAFFNALKDDMTEEVFDIILELSDSQAIANLAQYGVFLDYPLIGKLIKEQKTDELRDLSYATIWTADYLAIGNQVDLRFGKTVSDVRKNSVSGIVSMLDAPANSFPPRTAEESNTFVEKLDHFYNVVINKAPEDLGKETRARFKDFGEKLKDSRKQHGKTAPQMSIR